MFIRSLHIGSYGHFENKTIDELAPGLVVVHGPNEAGKSTLRQAIRWVLFGAQRGDKARWQGQSGDLNASLVLGTSGSGGEELAVHRVGTKIETRSATRKIDGDTALRAALGGTDLAMFDAIFSFDSFELQQIASLKGERLQALLAVGAIVGGGQHPGELITTLDKEAQLLWRPRGGCEIRESANKLKDAKERLSEAQRDAEAYAPLLGEADALTELLRELGRTLDVKRSEGRKAHQIFEAWPHYAKREVLYLRIADDPAGLETTPAAEMRAASALGAYKRARVERVTAEGALVEAEARVAAIVVDEAILTEGGAVRAITAETTRTRESVTRLEALTREATALRDGWERARRLIPGHIDDAALAGLPCGPASVAEARTHATVTATLLAEAGPQLLGAEATHARLQDEKERNISALSDTEPRALEQHLGAARAYLADTATHLELATRSADAEAKLAALGCATPATSAVKTPVLAPDALEALGAWRDDWTVAAASRDAALDAAQTAHVEALRDLAEAEAALEAVARDTNPQAAPEPVLARLEASGERARELVARIELNGRRQAELQRAQQDAAKALRLESSQAALASIDDSAPARHRVRRAFEAADSAARRLDASLERREAVASQTAGTASSEVVSVADAAAVRDNLVRARSAIDVYHQALTLGSGRRRRAAPKSWLSLAVLLAIAIIALVMAAYIIGAVAVVGAFAVFIVNRRERTGTRGGDPTTDGADREVHRALRAAALDHKASRSDVEVAIAKADDALADSKGIAARRASLGAIESELKAAREAKASADALAEAALVECGIPSDADLNLAEAYFAAAAAYREAGVNLGRLTAETETAEAQWAQLRAEFASAVPDGPGPFRLDAVLSQLSRLRAAAGAKRESANAASARHTSAKKTVTQAEAALKRAEGAPPVDVSLQAGWRAWANAHGLTGREPTTGLVAEMKALSAWASHQQSLVDAERAATSYHAQLKPFENQLHALTPLLDLGTETSLRGAIETLREAVEAELARRAARDNLKKRGEELEVRLEDAKERLTQAQAKMAKSKAAEAAFEAFAASIVAPETIGPREIEGWVEQLGAAQQAQRESAGMTTQTTIIRDELRSFMDRVESLAARLEVPCELRAPADAEALVTAWQGRLNAATEAMTRLAEREEQQRAHVGIVKALRQAEGTTREELAVAFAEASCADEAAWEARLGAREVEAEANREIAVLEAELRGSLGVDWQARMEAAMAEIPDREAWAERQGELAGAITELDRDRLEQERQLAEIRVKLKSLETSLAVVERAAEVETLEAELSDANERYWRNRIARRLLADTFERFRRTRQPAVIKQASSWLAEATDGAYTALDTEDDGAMTFVVVARDGRRHSADSLSTGTTGLVYLCLRLALALDQGRDGKALPIIADDILAHFDAERADGAARLLSRVADEGGVQVILFTCREETVATISRITPATRVIALPRWAGRALPAPRRGTTATVADDLFAKTRSKRT